jgi:hypothetical protein
VSRKELSFLVTSNYRVNTLRFGLPLWVARLLLGVACLGAVVVAASSVLLLTGALRLGRLSLLEHRNRELEAEFAKVKALRQRLVLLEQQCRKMETMLGIEKTPSPVNWDSASADSQGLPVWLKGKVWGTQLSPTLVPVENFAVSRRDAGEHEAVDLAAQEGAPVRATADAVVTQRGNDRTYGRFLLLRHGQGYESYYGHLQDWNVASGDSVRAGHTVGWVGSTGKSSAPHLHFEIRKDGARIDPATVLKFQ